MLKNSSRFENSSHFSYKDYKKKVNKKTNKDVKIFVSVFFAGLLVLLGLARLFAPNTEIGIPSVNDMTAADEDNTISSAEIDERLRSLKLEDENAKGSDEMMFSPELDEKVILPHQNKPTVGQIEAENNEIVAQAPAEQPSETEQKTQEQKVQVVQHTPKPQEKSQLVTTLPVQSVPEKTVITRVVVGSYATEKQAEVAKSIMQDAGLGITPVVKNIGGYYTLQVGSYTSKEKARQMMNNLLKSNFPARIVEDD